LECYMKVFLYLSNVPCCEVEKQLSIRKKDNFVVVKLKIINSFIEQ
jgi:hypothetical protein